LTGTAEPLDAELHDIAGREEHRRRLESEPDPGRGAGADDVAGEGVMNWLM
jgi:hypothetical protein